MLGASGSPASRLCGLVFVARRFALPPSPTLAANRFALADIAGALAPPMTAIFFFQKKIRADDVPVIHPGWAIFPTSISTLHSPVAQP